MLTAFSDRAVGLIGLLLATGCAPEQRASVAYVGLDVVDVDYAWADVVAVFSVANPDPLHSRIEQFSYTQAFAGLAWREESGVDLLQPDGSLALRLGLGTGYGALFEARRPTRGQDTIPMQLTARVGVSDDEDVVFEDFLVDVGFPALRPPTVVPTALALDALTETDAQFTVVFAIDNDLGSAVDVSLVDAEISLDGVLIEGHAVDDAVRVEGATASPMAFAFDVEVGGPGTPVYSALASGQGTIGLRADLRVDTPYGLLPLDVNTDAQLTF